MNREIENIDKIFIEGINSLYGDVPVSAGWRKLRTRLMFRELLTAKLIKISSVAVLSIMLLLPITNYIFGPLFTNPEINNIDRGGNQSKLTVLANHNEATNINTIETKGSEVIHLNAESKLISQLDLHYSAYNEIIPIREDRNSYILTDEFEHYTEPGYIINPLESKSISGDSIFGENHNSGGASFYDRTAVFDFIPILQTEKSTLFLGVSFGTDFIPDQSATLNHPSSLFFGGLSIKYEAKKFYLKSSINLGYYESINKYQYYFDTLVGQLVSSGYEIIPIINDQGDTTWSKVYNDALTDIYDTVISDDQINMTSFKTVISIPFSIGKNVVNYKRFTASVFGGVALNILISKQQSAPKYASNNHEIIQLKNSSSNEVFGQLYIHGGIMLDYRILHNTNITFSTAYNYGLINNHSNRYASPISFLNVNFGLLFKL